MAPEGIELGPLSYPRGCALIRHRRPVEMKRGRRSQLCPIKSSSTANSKRTAAPANRCATKFERSTPTGTWPSPTARSWPSIRTTFVPAPSLTPQCRNRSTRPSFVERMILDSSLSFARTKDSFCRGTNLLERFHRWMVRVRHCPRRLCPILEIRFRIGRYTARDRIRTRSRFVGPASPCRPVHRFPAASAPRFERSQADGGFGIDFRTFDRTHIGQPDRSRRELLCSEGTSKRPEPRRRRLLPQTRRLPRRLGPRRPYLVHRVSVNATRKGGTRKG